MKQSAASTVRVLVTVGLDPSLVERIRAVDPRIETQVLAREEALLFWGRPLPPGADADAVQKRLAKALAAADVLFGFPPAAHRASELLKQAPKLRWFQAASAGVDRLGAGGVLGRRVLVTSSSGIHATPIGEYVLGIILMFAKGLHRCLRAQAHREWHRYVPSELRGKTVGIVGMGHIGTEVARLAKAFGCRVLASRRSVRSRIKDHPLADELLPAADLPYLLGESDFVVVAVPLTAETRHLINEEALRAMKPTAFLINVAHGAVVDEAALVRALKEGRLAGAALDVFQREPLPVDSELWEMENVIVTPHISGGTELYFQRAVDLFCENLRRYLASEPLINLVDPERGY